jgi:hypothetical protein
MHVLLIPLLNHYIKALQGLLSLISPMPDNPSAKKLSFQVKKGQPRPGSMDAQNPERAQTVC